MKGALLPIPTFIKKFQHPNTPFNNYNILFSRQGLPFSLMILSALSCSLCPTLCDPMGCSLPGSSVHGILQARILEWVAIPFSRVDDLSTSTKGPDC